MTDTDVEFLGEYFLRSAENLKRLPVRLDREHALMAGGRNGPYFDIESPIRNTCHWLVTASVAHSLTGERDYKSIGQKLAKCVIESKEWRVSNELVHRQTPGKDWCNGVIGRAWVVEALFMAGELLQVDAARSCAEELVKTLPFDERLGAWIRLDPIKGLIGPDFTYNHQSWFASVAAEVAKDSTDVHRRVVKFLDFSQYQSFGTYKTGLIIHSMQNRPTNWNRLNPRRVLRRLFNTKSQNDAVHAPEPYERAVGYHLYVLYSLARLRFALPYHAIWQSSALHSAIRYCADEHFLAALTENHYTFPYNAPGFEFPMVAIAFEDIVRDLSTHAMEAFKLQVSKTWFHAGGLFSRGTYDSLTLSARVYELGLFLYAHTAGKTVRRS